MRVTQADLHEQLLAALQPILSSTDLDDETIDYICGMLTSQADEDSGSIDDIIEDVLRPFLESVQCSDEVSEQAEQVVSDILRVETSTATTFAAQEGAARKLLQGVVNMSSNLEVNDENEAKQLASLWGTDTGVKAMANTLIDAQNDKSSARDKRKSRKAEAEFARKLLQSKKDVDPDQELSGGLVKMSYVARSGGAGVDKKRDVLVRNVTISLPNGTALLENGELKFAYQRRYGLIGENGTGKSTLLKAISGQEIEGFPTHLRVLHVRQEVPSHFTKDLTVMDAVLQADTERMELIAAEKAIVAKLEEGMDGVVDEALSVEEKRKRLLAKKDDMKQLDADLKKLDDIYSRLQLLGSDNADARAAMILAGLQFSPEMQHALISSLSGGWKMRVALAAALFVEPEICMLDEPSNHLDLEAVIWLEEYLTTYKHTLIVVSHDRGFLNEVCTDIMELKHRKITYYRGNFSNYVKLRDEAIRNAMRVYEAYHSKREHMMDFITKFRANAKRATMVQSRIKAVEKMDAEAPEAVEVDQVWRFAIPNSEPLGPPIIAINDVYFDYKPTLPDGSRKPEDQFLLQKVNFGVDLTSKIALLGRNGQGKTTLLNLVMGRLKPMKGSISINGVLRIGHFTQHSADNFNLKLSALENLLNQFEEAEDQEMRSFLGRFQIQGNDALKPMMLLSGGQKSRVAFAALAFKKPHVLIIDEGSNHLSMEAVDALVEAMQDFKGGIMVVSHDEYFVSKTCTELWVVDEGHVSRVRGSFQDYKEKTSVDTQKRVEESIKRLNAANN
ncbi:hypothetical protein MPSEU_000389500 [Mayamaea pseudoterrestris]|nr:hypothetical protein MPSEU_000389500 [Mayamaea pseudoterrestris]